ncbi:MAG: hypothetical protein E7402_00505 [Ruminococcaceae bacterium]|nr:hypothetical protein [Oscillospiraceae bacterium]
MKIFTSYITSIIIISIIALVLENLIPGTSSKKYIRIVIGLLVMLVILHPLQNLPHYSSQLAIPHLYIDEHSFEGLSPRPYIAETFERRLALSISQEVYSHFGKSVSCRVHCIVNEAGQITGIHRVLLEPHSAEIAAFVSEKFGFEEDIVNP